MVRLRTRGSAIVAIAAAGLLSLAGTASASGRAAGDVAVAPVGQDVTGCIAHPVGDPDGGQYYLHGCTGHDEPELDPVSSAAGSALDITWKATLASDGFQPVSNLGFGYWFGGTVHTSNPARLGGQGFLELQFYPDTLVRQCKPTGGFVIHPMPNVYTACSPVWTLIQKGQDILEPAAFNGMLVNQAGTGPLVMHGGDTIDVHIWAPSMDEAYREQVHDESTGEDSAVLVLNSPEDGPLTPQFSTQEIGNALNWGLVNDTPMSFVWEIGHASLYGSPPAQFCVPGQTICNTYDTSAWQAISPLRIQSVTFGDGSHPTSWAVVSDTGGKAAVLGKSFIGATDCSGYGGPFCIYPWFAWDGSAFTYGTQYPATVDNLGRAGQFAKQARCPVNIFDQNTYCDTVVY
jgi:hypothetical protein